MIEWLCKTFGFEKKLVVAGSNNAVMHSQLAFGNGMIMVGSVDSGTPGSALIKHPDEIGGAETQMLSLMVSDCASLYARSKGRRGKNPLGVGEEGVWR
jgi:uncharacterized glyoxalase superfamily protein PhnB